MIVVTEIASRRCFSVPGLSLAQVSLVSKRNTLRDLVLLLPFRIAGLVTVFLSIADRLRIGTDQLAQLSFLFAKPWAWLLDFGAVPGLSHSTRGLGLYVLLLWIPAALYSAALCLLARISPDESKRRPAERPTIHRSGSRPRRTASGSVEC